MRLDKRGSAAELRIVQVSGKTDLNNFIGIPENVFASDPVWVTPLLSERRMYLSTKHNPYFEHARWQAWIAWRGDQPVGRISAQIDALHLERYQDKTGFFGMLDAEDNQETFDALLRTAEQWLRDQGMVRVRGPFNLSINAETGLLVEGFDTPPVLMMGHARPYYAKYIERHGYGKVIDTLAYTVAPDFPTPAVMQKMTKRATRNVKVRQLDIKRLDEEMELLRDIFNDAWAENWGFVPFTAAEFKALGQELRMLIGPDLVQIAEVEGEAAAFIVALPNVNEVIRDLRGRLFPTGWIKLLWRLKLSFPSTARVPLMGVRRKFQHTLLGPGLSFLMIDAVRMRLHKRGVKMVELSWILESNAGMRGIIEAIGGRAYKRYRIYERQLDHLSDNKLLTAAS